jgi:hypothetical protein
MFGPWSNASGTVFVDSKHNVSSNGATGWVFTDVLLESLLIIML